MNPRRFRQKELIVARNILKVPSNRRRFLALCASAGIAPTLLGLGAGRARAEAGEIVLSNWGGDSSKVMERVYGEAYTKETGIPVHFDSSPQEGRIKAMVESGKVVWDVMDVDAFSAIKLGRQGYLRPIDYSIVSRDTLPGLSFEHGVGAYVLSFVLAYDKSKFPDGPPQSWADFWDVQRFPGKRSLYKWATGALDAALMADGIQKDRLYPLDTGRAFGKIQEIKDHLIFWDSGAQSQQMLRSGEVSMACIWHSRAHMLEEETGGRITFDWNQGIAFSDAWSVPVDNPAGDGVWPFLAFMQGIDRQLGLLAGMAAGPVTAEANAATPPDLRRINPGLPDNWKVLAPMDANWWADHYDEVLADYTDLIAG